MCCCFSPASTTLKSKKKSSIYHPSSSTFKKKQQQQNQNNLTLLVLTEFFFLLPACSYRKRKLYRKTSHSYDAESNALWCPAFFSPLCEIFCAQLLNNTWKHMKWKKKNSSKISSDLAFQKKSNKTKTSLGCYSNIL